MVDSLWSRTILHYDKDNSWNVADITNDTSSVPIFTRTGTEQINLARLIVLANNGHYIRDQRSGESGFPTKIDHFDRIGLTVLDGDGGSYAHYFDVVKKVPIKVKQKGTTLRLELEGIERWLNKVNYATPIDFGTPSEVIEDIVDYYNTQKTSDMPTVTLGTNELPNLGAQHFDFGVNEETCWNRIVEVLDSMGASGSNGGALNFFDARLTANTHLSITLDIIESGDPNNGKPSVTVTANNVNVGETDGGIDEPEGTLINSWGSNDGGTLPIEYSKFKSRQFLMPTNQGVDSQFPDWDNSQTYPQGAIVVNSGLVWQSDTDNNKSTPGVSNWTQLTTESYYGGQIQYSPWTDGMDDEWKNSGTDPSNSFTGNFGPSMWDGNLIVNDDVAFRTDADVSVVDPNNINTNWLYNGVNFYSGLRVLVNGTGVGDFSGHDNKIMEYDDENDEWFVRYDPVSVGTSMQCVVHDEGRIYMWDHDGTTSGTGQWENITTLDNGADCLHPYTSLINTTSVHLNPDTGIEYLGTNVDSAIESVYEWESLASWLNANLTNRTTADYYSSGGWLSIRFPFPKNTYNNIVLNDNIGLGDLYGGGDNPDDPREPTFVDARNMHFSHDGKRGFNQGSSSEDFGPLNAIDFFMKIHYQYGPTGGSVTTTALKANFKMRCFLFDRNDHVVYQDFTLPFNNEWTSISLPLSGFQIYRGRKPRYNAVLIDDVVPPKGLDAVEQFEWRHIRQICWQTQESYDDFGRYNGGQGDFGVLSYFGNSFRRIRLAIDGLRFRKPLLVNTGQVVDLDVEPDFLQRPDISIYDQLQSDAFAELEKAQFKNTQYDINTTGKFDIEHGDFYLFKDDEIVDETDSGDNTVKLVSKYQEFSMTKPRGGQGGLTRRLRGSRRFE